jgi:sodium-dependent dicarboxylate transporter 2/3/5
VRRSTAGPARGLLAALLAAAGGWALGQAGGLDATARTVLGVFGLAVIGWSVLALDDVAVALAAVLALLGLGVVPAAALPLLLRHELVWLLLGAGLLAAVLADSGLVERWTWRALAGVRSVQALLYRLTAVIAATAFVLPSTTARAALLLPVFLLLARALGDARLTRALALLFPSAILLSAGASLLGAGAHLIALDQLARLGGPVPGYLGWALLAAPFALGACALATLLIGRLFLPAELRAAAPSLPPAPGGRASGRQRAVAALLALTVIGWATGGWHGVDAAWVAVAGGLLACCRPLTGAGLAAMLPRVEWKLLLFLACGLLLGEALVKSGAAAALAGALLQAGPAQTAHPAGAVALAAGIALLSHLLLHSRSARVVVLLPTVALPLAAGGLNPALLVMVVVLGSGFCQTTAQSAKPVLLFARAEGAGLAAADLLRLALALLAPLALGLLALALWVWPLQGLPLRV